MVSQKKKRLTKLSREAAIAQLVVAKLEGNKHPSSIVTAFVCPDCNKWWLNGDYETGKIGAYYACQECYEAKLPALDERPRGWV